MSTEVAVYLQDAHTIRQGMEIAKYAESKGFHAIWQAESRLVREATVPMSAFLAVTERIKVGSGVVNNWTRNPALLASTFSTLDDLAPGRVILGIGAWWEPLASKVGVHRVKPLVAMRETIEAVRALLADENVTYYGEFVHLDGVELDYVHQERRPKDVPIYLGATGMQMMELAGEIADGVVLNYLVSPIYNDMALDHLERGANKAGRSATDLDRPQLVVCSLDEDRSAALDAARSARDPVPRPTAPHHEGIRRPRVVAGGHRQGTHVAGDRRTGRGRLKARARRDRADDHRLGNGRRVQGEGRRVRTARVHLPDPLSTRRRRARHDRRLCRLDRLAGDCLGRQDRRRALRAAPRAVGPARGLSPAPRADRHESGGLL